MALVPCIQCTFPSQREWGECSGGLPIGQHLGILPSIPQDHLLPITRLSRVANLIAKRCDCLGRQAFVATCGIEWYAGYPSCSFERHLGWLTSRLKMLPLIAYPCLPLVNGMIFSYVQQLHPPHPLVRFSGGWYFGYCCADRSRLESPFGILGTLPVFYRCITSDGAANSAEYATVTLASVLKLFLRFVHGYVGSAINLAMLGWVVLGGDCVGRESPGR